MKHVLGATLAAALLAVTTPAHASHTGYLGGCSGSAVPENVSGQNQWRAAVSISATATTAAGSPAPYPISVECRLVIDGVDHGDVLTAAGLGAASNAGSVSYTAAAAAVELCTYAVVDAEIHPPTCVPL